MAAEQGKIIIEGHEEADHGRALLEWIEEQRDESIIQGPGQTNAEKAESQQPSLFSSSYTPHHNSAALRTIQLS